MTRMNKDEALAFLRSTVKPSLGCTEPACAALCAAAAAQELRGDVRGVALTVNPGLYKNGMSVAIPGFDRVGMDYAAALGALIGSTAAELQIFEGITPEVAERARELVESGRVRVDVDRGQRSIYARCEVTSDGEVAEAVIRGAHTNVVMVSHNGTVRFQGEKDSAAGAADPTADLQRMTIAQISRLVDGMGLEELDWLLEGIGVNDAVAEYGTEHPSPVGIASTLQADLGTGEADQMMRAVGAAIESRLDGCPRSVTSSAGAGSKGLALTIPLGVAARHAGSSPLELARALAFGHLVNSYINAVVGKLSAVCTCATAASTAASAALVKLWGGSEEQMGLAIRNMTGTVSGMICDGGKTGCAMKLAMATSAAYLSARMAVGGSSLRVSDGICADTPEQCITNVAQVANVGMADVDEQILRIMLQKKGEAGGR